MKKLIAPFILILLLCGCGEYKEINNGYLVTSVAFEKSGSDTQITVNILLPENDENLILTGSGIDLTAAFKALQKSQVKNFYFEHCGTVVLNQNVKNDVFDILNFCKNDIKMPVSARVVYCNNASSLFDADNTGYDVITLLKNSKQETDNRLYKIEQSKKSPALPLVKAEQDTIYFEGEIK